VRILLVTHYFWPESFLINDVVADSSSAGTRSRCTRLPNYPGGRFFDGYGFFGPFKENFKGAEVRRAPVIPRGSAGRARLALNYLSHAFCATLFAPFLARGEFDAILVFEPSPIRSAFRRVPADVQARAARFLGTGFVAREPFGHRRGEEPGCAGLVDRLIKWITAAATACWCNRRRSSRRSRRTACRAIGSATCRTARSSFTGSSLPPARTRRRASCQRVSA